MSLSRAIACTSCGYENASSASFCLNCGKRLTVECSQCSKTLLSNVRFCDDCGTPVPPQAPENFPPPTEDPSVSTLAGGVGFFRRRRFLLIGSSILVVVVVVAVVLILVIPAVCGSWIYLMDCLERYAPYWPQPEPSPPPGAVPASP